MARGRQHVEPADRCGSPRDIVADDVDGDDDVGLARQDVERHRVCRAAIDIDRAVEGHRPEDHRRRRRGSQCRHQQSAVEDPFRLGEEVGCNHLRRNLELLEPGRKILGHHRLEQMQEVEPPAGSASRRLRVFLPSRARRPDQVVRQLPPVDQAKAHIVAYIGGRHARRIRRAEYRADRRPRDDRRSDAEFIERGEHVDVRYAARSSPAERQTD